MSTNNVICTCGAVLQAKPQHAGKTVQCPKCGQHVTVPGSQAAASATAIRVLCKCGKVLNAMPNLAGKRVKCPRCGRQLAIPSSGGESAPTDSNVAHDDPLGLGALANSDPLGIGEPEGAPLGPHGRSETATAPAAHTGFATHTPSTKGRSSRSRMSQRDLAGWVAVCFGGYQVVVSGLQIARVLLVCMRGGSLIPLLSLWTVLTALGLGLGVWLALLGAHIVRQLNPRQSLERAAQASMIYIMLFILGLILAVIPLVRLFAHSTELGFFALASIFTNVIYIAPAAFIIYVDRQQE